MAAHVLTDRAFRYRAQQAIPAHEKRCAFCGKPWRKATAARPVLEVGHVNGAEDDDSPDNLTWVCRPCNVLAGYTLRAAGMGRLTRQFNPTKGGGAANIGEWIQAVGAITPHIDRGDRGISSTMPVPEAVAMIRATPHNKRSQFAAQLRSRMGARARYNPMKKQNLFGLGTPKALSPRQTTAAHGGIASHARKPSKRSASSASSEIKGSYRGYSIARDEAGEYYFFLGLWLAV